MCKVDVKLLWILHMWVVCVLYEDVLYEDVLYEDEEKHFSKWLILHYA